MTAPRKPAAFRIEPEPAPKQQAAKPTVEAPPRRPRAVGSETAVVMPAEVDVFDEPNRRPLPHRAGAPGSAASSSARSACWCRWRSGCGRTC